MMKEAEKRWHLFGTLSIQLYQSSLHPSTDTIGRHNSASLSHKHPKDFDLFIFTFHPIRRIVPRKNQQSLHKTRHHDSNSN
ncbi:unnamed protein product [Tuber melanosporum]|uniref:(Perigord truffle) hypothetical protein n=1 Tax=Tuber melanosporum (strain Mel28) TaxID=656061 RepID=D5G7U9_TUBMM|nr:uncharacterized protein GSTUM_00002664001 [Tuber melanosporum]CAZ80592.1 unnamed protein product [Tuber melanosporum]